jgi:hypothetical protein
MDGIQELGQRIVDAARLAVAVHFYESVARTTTPENGAALRAARQILRPRVEIGGAGPRGAPDGGGQLEPASSRLGDLVTDDERNGLMGRDNDNDDDDEDDDRQDTIVVNEDDDPTR